MPSLKLSQSEVKKIVADPEKQVLYRDTEMPGLALRITPNGIKTYVFNYSLQGRERRMRIGDATSCNILEARDIARRLTPEVGAETLG